MWGNQRGWIFAAIIAVGMGALLTFAVIPPGMTAPTRTLTLAMKPADFSIDPNAIVPPPTGDSDAGPIYRQAGDEWSNHSDIYEEMQKNITTASNNLPAPVTDILSASDYGKMDLFATHLDDVIGYRDRPTLLGLYTAGQLLNSLALLHTKGKYTNLKKASQYATAEFNLGRHLYQERIVFDEWIDGLSLMSNAAMVLALAEKNPSRVQTDKEFGFAVDDFVKNQATKLWSVIGGMSEEDKVKYAGDMFLIARESPERMWRVEATLKLGKFKFNAPTKGDQIGAERSAAPDGVGNVAFARPADPIDGSRGGALGGKSDDRGLSAHQVKRVSSPTEAVIDQKGAAPGVLPDVASISNASLLAWMFRFLRPVRTQVFFACAYLTFAVGAEVLAVKQTGRAADAIQRLSPVPGGVGSFLHWFLGPSGRLPSLVDVLHNFAADTRDLPALLLGLVLVTAAFLFLRYRRFVAEARLSMMVVFYIREAVYDKLQRVGFGFHDALSSGQLINRALTDLQNVRAFIQTAVLTTLEITLIVGGYMILVLTLSPWVAALSLLPLPVWTWYILRFSRRVQPAAKAVMEADDRNVSIIAENIAGVHVVKAFAIEDQEIKRYDAHCKTFFQRMRDRISILADFTPVIRGIASASYLILFLAAGLLMIHGKLRAGDFLILGSAMGQILSRLQAVSVINEQYQNAIVSARRLYEVLHAPATVPQWPGAIALPPGPGAVRFEAVQFGYDPSKPVLRDISFDVKGGSRVAIVGPTGSGKTTLVNLLARFYDPGEGRILIDGKDIRDLTLASLRTQVAFVFQETYLFSDTVAANIAYGRPNISFGDIEAASRLAQRTSSSSIFPADTKRCSASAVHPSPAARNSASRSPALFLPIRASSSSTTPPPASIRRPRI